ncbi:histone-lysine N-methyltransferase, H3 lysine-9 specific SUVH7-like [Bidens hawaiensis]|uniref:histone-lysine N-methyltransferase, H3 lysine-9 specific SUVH7-like n=1 Tax=Bidens hawaiensis TaxID=980011 RepID=UPI00404A44FF
MMIPRKRPLVQAIRDFPPGCGINLAERKPVKSVNSNSVDSNKLNTSKLKEFGGNKPSGKVKFWDQNCTKTGFDRKPKVITTREPPATILKRFNDVDTKEYGGNKPSADSKPSVNTGFDQKPKVVTAYEPPTKILKRLDNVERNEFGVNKLYVVSKPSGNTEFDQKPKVIIAHGPEKNVLNKSYLGAKTASKVKFYDPTCEVQKSEVQKSEDKTVIASRNKLTKREKIQQAMAVFDEVYEPFCQENKLKPKNERIQSAIIPTEVAKVVKQKLKWVDPEKIVGPVCGVLIGDKFKYRSQLMMTGLHSQPQSGIDYAKINGENVAISIVDAHRYSNESGSSDTLVYFGQGGVSMFGSNKSAPEDQKLVRGNLAMKNSMDRKTEVRVIKKVQGFGRDVFVYDGLYVVVRYTEEESAEGKTVFKFHLKRVPGQPSLHKMLKW